MKKSITIPKIEEELYNNIKAKAEEKNQSISDYVSYLFSHADDIYSNKELLDELKKEIEVKNITISLQTNKIKNLENKVESNNDLILEIETLNTEKKNLEEKVKTLTEECGKFDEQRAELKAQIQALQENQQATISVPNSVTLQFEDFDFAVLQYCLKIYNENTGKNLSKAELLKFMFNEYAVKGSIYFFKTPGYFKLREIQKEVQEKQKNLQ